MDVCNSIPFKPGQRYLVFPLGPKDPSGPKESMWDGLCTATRRLEDAQFELDYLRRFRDRRPVPSVFGTVLLDRSWYPGSTTPENAVVVAKRGSKSFQAKTDPEGRYQFFDLKSGRYTISVDVEGYLPLAAERIKLDQCKDLDFEFLNDSSVEGRLTDAGGKRLRDARVELRAMDTVDWYGTPRRFTVSETTGRSGRYRFERIPPGRYQLVAPSIGASSGAIVIEPGSKLVGIDLVDEP